MNATNDKSSGAPAQPSQDDLGQVDQICILLTRLAGDISSKDFEPANGKLGLMRSTLLLCEPCVPGLALAVLASQHVIGAAVRLFQNDESEGGESVPEREWDVVSADSESAIVRITQSLQRSDDSGIYEGVASFVIAIERLIERRNGLHKAWDSDERLDSEVRGDRLQLLVKRAFESGTLDQCLPARRPGGLYLLREELYSAAWLTGSHHLRLASYLMSDIAGEIARSVHETQWDEEDWEGWAHRILAAMSQLQSGLATEDTNSVFSALDNLCLTSTHVNFRGLLYL